MVPDDRADSDPQTRANALIRRGVERGQSEDFAAALADFEQAARIADDAGIAALVAAAVINQGWVRWLEGDTDAACALYVEGADLARTTGDTARLCSALRNFAAASRQAGRPEQAVAALEEYILLVPDDPAASTEAHLECGLAFVEMRETEAAGIHFDEAVRVAGAGGLPGLVSQARIHRGAIHDGEGEHDLALACYQEALDAAREAGDETFLAGATMTLAQAWRSRGNTADANPLFGEAEDFYRAAGDHAGLADALYWHAVSLRDGGLSERALGTWREEEAVRRELDDARGLGDCLFQQAAVLRSRDEHSQVNEAYVQSQDAYRAAGEQQGLAEALAYHAEWLREQGRADEALAKADEALAAAVASGYRQGEFRARVARAMLLADAGDTAAASQELDAAEFASIEVGDHSATASLHARRAYVRALEGRSPEAVADQLRFAHEYGRSYGVKRAARSAILSAAAEIKHRCGAEYREALSAVVADVRSAPAEG